jgi:hypothetical protein
MTRVILSALILLSLAAPAQQYYNDAQLRAHLNLDWKLSKRFSVYLTNQTRFTKNATTMTRTAFDLGMTYKILKDLRISAEGRVIEKLNSYDYYNTRLWYAGSVVYRKKVRRWAFLYRNLFQARYRDLNSDQTMLVRYYDRSKLTVKYEATKRYTFYAGAEAYVPLNDPTFKGVDRMRGFTGVEIATTKNQTLELYFMYQAYLYNSSWFKQPKKYDNQPLKRDYIYGISYSFSF